MCNKIDNRIECYSCGYPYSEALYPDDSQQPLACNSSQDIIDTHIREIERLRADQSEHYYDCKCLICV